MDLVRNVEVQTHNHNNGQATNHAGKPDPGRNLRQSIEATCPNAASNFSATHAEFNHSGYAILAANLRGTQYKHYTYGTTLGHLASPQETQQTSRLWGIWRDLMREENVSHCQNSVLVEHVANEGCHASVSASTSSVSATVVDPICHCGAVYEGLITIKIK